MNVEWLHHTGFNVSDMEQSLRFYRDLLGLEVTTDIIFEGEIFEQMTSLKDPRARIVFLSNGDSRHLIELIQFLTPIGDPTVSPALNSVGWTHLGMRVDDVEEFYNRLSELSVEFVNPPAIRSDAIYPRPQKFCLMKDPDGNVIELIELAPQPQT